MKATQTQRFVCTQDPRLQPTVFRNTPTTTKSSRQQRSKKKVLTECQTQRHIQKSAHELIRHIHIQRFDAYMWSHLCASFDQIFYSLMVFCFTFVFFCQLNWSLTVCMDYSLFLCIAGKVNSTFTQGYKHGYSITEVKRGFGFVDTLTGQKKVTTWI